MSRIGTQSKALVDKAIGEFGGLDIVVNNAGILRDKMLYNMSEDEWDAVIRVHLKGHFCVSRHATAYWREKSKEAEGKPVYGRIINTSSESYLFGSPGQANYAAAKGGIIGLTLSTANACGRFGVTANAICPRARTKMTENLPGGMFDKPEEGFDAFHPDNVAPLVGFLASPGGGEGDRAGVHRARRDGAVADGCAARPALGPRGRLDVGRTGGGAGAGV